MAVLKLIFIILSCDQGTKLLARILLDADSHIECLGGLVQFSLIFNYDGFASLFHGLGPELKQFFMVPGITLVLVFGTILLHRLHKSNNQLAFPLSFVLAGGAGNLIDRFFNDGAVIDFITLGNSIFQTGVFNLADLAILAGSFGLGYNLLTAPDRRQS
jgi:signal peptidase II